MEVTLQDIAKELEISAATVSRSLRHDRAINPETRARVNEVARRLGYKSRVGRPRRPVETNNHVRTLGLLVRHSSLDRAHHDTNLMKMMAGIMSVADGQGMHMKVYTWSSQEPRPVDEAPSLLPPMIQEGTCQALIVHGEQDEQALAFLVNRMPVVSMGRVYRDLPVDAAVADNIGGVFELVTHLVELGHRRLAWVGAYHTSSFMEEREAGFMKACRKHGLGLGRHTFLGPEIYKAQHIHAKDSVLAAVDAGATAFVCGNDAVAYEIMDVLEAAGKRVPEDVNVTGFDAWANPTKSRQLTSMDPRFFQIGKAAARLAMQRIAQPVDEPCIVSVRGEMVPGSTTSPAPQQTNSF